MSPHEVSEKSRGILNRLIALPLFQEARHVTMYLNTQNEVETLPLLSHCLKLGKEVSVPVVLENHQMILAAARTEDFQKDYIENRYHILEPKERIEVAPTVPDLILVPGAVFDREGYRIGYGGGYYDRLLPKTRGTTIGLCYDFQLLSSLPHEAHDIPLHGVLSETHEIILNA